MKKWCLSVMLSFCLGLVATTTWLLATPVRALGATCTHNCGGGIPPVSCTGASCFLTAKGCCSVDSSGNTHCTICGSVPIGR